MIIFHVIVYILPVILLIIFVLWCICEIKSVRASIRLLIGSSLFLLTIFYFIFLSNYEQHGTQSMQRLNMIQIFRILQELDDPQLNKTLGEIESDLINGELSSVNHIRTRLTKVAAEGGSETRD